MAGTIADQEASFEDWWSKKQVYKLFPVGMKPILRLAFQDGWYRVEKHMRQTDDQR